MPTQEMDENDFDDSFNEALAVDVSASSKKGTQDDDFHFRNQDGATPDARTKSNLINRFESSDSVPQFSRKVNRYNGAGGSGFGSEDEVLQFNSSSLDRR